MLCSLEIVLRTTVLDSQSVCWKHKRTRFPYLRPETSFTFETIISLLIFAMSLMSCHVCLMHTEYGWFGGLRASEDLGNWIIWPCYACSTQEQLTIFCNENIRQAKGNLSFVLLNIYWVRLLEDYIVFEDDDWRSFFLASNFCCGNRRFSIWWLVVASCLFYNCFIFWSIISFAHEFQNSVKCTV